MVQDVKANTFHSTTKSAANSTVFSPKGIRFFIVLFFSVRLFLFLQFKFNFSWIGPIRLAIFPSGRFSIRLADAQTGRPYSNHFPGRIHAGDFLSGRFSWIGPHPAGDFSIRKIFHPDGGRPDRASLQ
jgi:hypothetical protein